MRDDRFGATPSRRATAKTDPSGASTSFAHGYVDMMRAKDEGVDNGARRTDGPSAPTTFRRWCEEELTPAIGA